jgi:hypothetical protein
MLLEINCTLLYYPAGCYTNLKKNTTTDLLLELLDGLLGELCPGLGLLQLGGQGLDLLLVALLTLVGLLLSNLW